MTYTTWFVSGSNRGMGLQWVTQASEAYNCFSCCQTLYQHDTLRVLQILNMPDTFVVAGGRPGDEVEGLNRLQQQYQDRLNVVDLEVTSVASVQAGCLSEQLWVLLIFSPYFRSDSVL